MEEKIIQENQEKNNVKKKTFKIKGWHIFLILLLIIISVWIFTRPGVFSIQPIGALPDGITIIYHSRGPEMPFFSSPDSLCMDINGGVSLMCRGMAIGAASELMDRIIIRLPYIHWAYLRSTGGVEFYE